MVPSAMRVHPGFDLPELGVRVGSILRFFPRNVFNDAAARIMSEASAQGVLVSPFTGLAAESVSELGIA